VSTIATSAVVASSVCAALLRAVAVVRDAVVGTVGALVSAGGASTRTIATASARRRLSAGVGTCCASSTKRLRVTPIGLRNATSTLTTTVELIGTLRSTSPNTVGAAIRLNWSRCVSDVASCALAGSGAVANVQPGVGAPPRTVLAAWRRPPSG